MLRLSSSIRRSIIWMTCLCLSFMIMPATASSTNWMKIPSVVWKQQVDGFPLTPVLDRNGDMYITVRERAWPESPGKLYAFTRDGNLKWTFPLAEGSGNPVIDDENRVFITDGTLHALNTENGSEIWKLSKASGQLTGTPTLHQDKIFVADSANGTVSAADLRGNLLWEDKISVRPGVLSPVVLDKNGDMYVVHTVHINRLTTEEPFSELYHYEDGTQAYSKFESVLYAFDSDGFPKWSTKLDGLEALKSAPLLSSDGDIIIGSNLLYIVRSNGTIKWNTSESGHYNPGEVSIKDDRIYYPVLNSLYIYSFDGTMIKGLSYGSLLGKPLIAEDGTTYIWNEIGWLRAIYPSGELKWTYEMAEGTIGVVGSSSVTSGADNDNLLYTAYATMNADSEWVGYVLVFKDPMPASLDTQESQSSAPSASSDGVRVLFDGVEMTLSPQPMLVRGRVFVPMRDLFTKLGATLEIKNGVITANKNGTSLIYKPSEKTATINGRTIVLDAPGKIVNGRTMVPLRFVSELFGYHVEWKQSLKEVTISSQ